MNSENNQQAYDRGVSIFSPDGRLYQVEYARESVKRGAPSIGVRTADGIVLAVQTRARSSLRVSESIEKIHKVDDQIGVASTGHVADGRKLVDRLRVLTRQEELRYGERSTVTALSKQMADHIQETTQAGGTRPYGVSLLIGGIDDDGPHLFVVEPGGTPSEWRATAVGTADMEARTHLEEEYTEDLSIEDGILLAMETLQQVADDDLSSESVDIATIDADAGFQTLPAAEVDDYIADANGE